MCPHFNELPRNPEQRAELLVRALGPALRDGIERPLLRRVEEARSAEDERAIAGRARLPDIDRPYHSALIEKHEPEWHAGPKALHQQRAVDGGDCAATFT